MGTEREGRLLFSMAWPIIISMLVQALYNVVDTYFVSQTSNAMQAKAALGFAYPIQMLMISFSVGTAVGMNSLISRRLGERRVEDANRAAANGTVLMVLTSMAFVLFGCFGARPLMSLMSQDAQVVEYGARYLFICCTFSLGQFVAIGLERVMSAQGKTVLTMVMQMSGGIANIILDAIFVPRWGIEGAAIATVMGQWIGMILSILIVVIGKHEVTLRLKLCALKKDIVKDIYAVGLPSVIMQAISVVMIFGMDFILEGLAPTVGAAVFGVYYKVQSLVFMPIFGLTNAAMSIEGYNFGARNCDRLMRVLKLSIVCTMVFMAIGTLLFELLPEQILDIFNSTAAEKAIGVPALRLISPTFVVAAICISLSTFFGAIGKGMYSMWISLIRQLFVLLPAAFVLSLIFKDIALVWWAYPIAELASLTAGLVFFSKTRKKELAALLK